MRRVTGSAWPRTTRAVPARRAARCTAGARPTKARAWSGFASLAAARTAGRCGRSATPCFIASAATAKPTAIVISSVGASSAGYARRKTNGASPRRTRRVSARSTARLSAAATPETDAASRCRTPTVAPRATARTWDGADGRGDAAWSETHLVNATAQSLHHGSSPVARGRLGSLDQSLHDPS